MMSVLQLCEATEGQKTISPNILFCAYPIKVLVQIWDTYIFRTIIILTYGLHYYRVWLSGY